MKKGFTKFCCAVLTAAMTFSCVPFAPMNFTATKSVQAASAFAESKGWFESAYVEWNTVPGATGFAAYVKGANEADSAYVQLDNELIRKYPTYFRADAVGLKAGQYVMKVVPVINGKLDESAAMVSDTLDVKAYDRSGFAFSPESPFKSASGAYNDDGTLKSNAKVFYVTKDTAKTIKADVITGSGGATTTFTGMQAIITAKQKGLDKTPFDFRIIGTIEAGDMDGFDSSEEGVQIKGKNSYSELNITIEGIGEDAGVKGFGFLLRNAGNVEMRNFAIMYCMDDSISMDTDNANIWVHNVDLFYGKPGSAADQAKGDGTVDIKGDSQYITVSYNHLFDSGKASLCGMTSESGPNHITYHHNWFDHSDSRHPRIRTMSVHVYNNYYDGNSKYGVGAAKNSSAFVENNVFENCKHPMLTSKQGSDIMENAKTGAPDFSAKGTFSGEDGGVIKAFNNIISGSDADKFNGGYEPAYYDASATGTNGKATQYDAYLASTREEQVPSSVKALLGGTTYDNASLDVSRLNATPEDVNTVKSTVTSYAGRMNGGDFFDTIGKPKSSFTGLTDAASSDVDSALTAAINGYKSSLVSVGGMEAGGEVDTTVSTESTTASEETTEATTNDETTTETTTEAPADSTPVELGEAQATDIAGANYVEHNAATDEYTLFDTSAEKTELTLPFKNGAISSGKVIVKGTATPSKNSGKWAFVQVRGTKADGTEGDIVSFCSDANKNLALRTDGANYSSTTTPIGANTKYSYEFLIDLDAKTVDLAIDGQKVSGTFTGKDISAFYAVTAGSDSRNVTVSTPYVGVVSGEITDSTTESSTESTTESSTESTTESTTQSEDGVWGDADASGKLTANDSACILAYVLDPVKANLDPKVIPYLDVDASEAVGSNDSALVLQRVLIAETVFPAENK